VVNYLNAGKTELMSTKRALSVLILYT